MVQLLCKLGLKGLSYCNDQYLSWAPASVSSAAIPFLRTQLTPCLLRGILANLFCHKCYRHRKGQEITSTSFMNFVLDYATTSYSSPDCLSQSHDAFGGDWNIPILKLLFFLLILATLGCGQFRLFVLYSQSDLVDSIFSRNTSKFIPTRESSWVFTMSMFLFGLFTSFGDYSVISMWF